MQKSDRILVSIIVPTYNHVKYIEDCIKGIIDQKVTFEIEVLIGDHESNDGTTEIIEKYVKLDKRIKLLKSYRKDVIYINGTATGRNNFINLLKNAKGKYIALCDGDDYWIDENKLQKQVDFLEANLDYGICFTNNLILKNDKLINNEIKFSEGRKSFDINDLINGNFMHTPTVMLRNDFDYNDLPEWFNKVILGDWCLYLIVLGERKIRYLEDITAVYRVHSGGVWSSKTKAEQYIESYNIYSILEENIDPKYKTRIHEIKKSIIGELNKGLENDKTKYFNKNGCQKLINNSKKYEEATKVYKGYFDKENNKLDLLKAYSHVYIYGVGIVGTMVIQNLFINSIHIDCIIDRGVLQYMKYKVVSSDEIGELDHEGAIIVTITNEFENIKASLEESGFKNIFSIADLF